MQEIGSEMLNTNAPNENPISACSHNPQMEAAGLTLLSTSSRVMNHVSNVSSVRSWFCIFSAALLGSCSEPIYLFPLFSFLYEFVENVWCMLQPIRLPTHCSAAERR